jgi:hypothetical protein
MSLSLAFGRFGRGFGCQEEGEEEEEEEEEEEKGLIYLFIYSNTTHSLSRNRMNAHGWRIRFLYRDFLPSPIVSPVTPSPSHQYPCAVHVTPTTLTPTALAIYGRPI